MLGKYIKTKQRVSHSIQFSELWHGTYLKLTACNAVAEAKVFQDVFQCNLVGWLDRIRRKGYIFL